MSELIEQWREGDIAARDRSSAAIVAAWERWSADELETLERALRDTESEVAQRARQALTHIRIRCAITPKLAAKLPNMAAVLCGGRAAEGARLLAQAAEIWRNGALADDDLRSLAIAIVRVGLTFDARELLQAARWHGEHGETFAVGPYAALLVPLLRHADVDIRARAAETLGRAGAPEHAGELTRVLQDPSPEVRAEAAGALGLLRAGAHAERIVPLLRDSYAGVRASAAEALGRMGSREHASKIAQLLEDADAKVRLAAATALGRVEAVQHAAVVLRLVKDEDRDVRGTAARTLGWLGARECAGSLTPLLKDRDEWVRRTAADSLGVLGAADCAENMAGLLADDSWTTRLAAVRALGRIGVREQAAAITPVLRDSELRVRWAAAKALGRLGASEQAVRIVPLLKDADQWAREAGLEALCYLRAREHSGDVVPLLKDPFWGVRTSAINALGWMDAQGHIRDIVPLLKDENAFCRFRAALALADFASEDCLAALEAAEGDPTWDVGIAAGIGLMILGRKDIAHQRKLVDDVAARAAPGALVNLLLDALARVHDKEIWDKLHRKTQLPRAIESWDGLRGFMTTVGLRLEAGSVPLIGRISGGVTTTPAGALGWLLDDDDCYERPPQAVFPESGSVRLMTPRDALKKWRERLRGTK